MKNWMEIDGNDLLCVIKGENVENERYESFVK